MCRIERQQFLNFVPDWAPRDFNLVFQVLGYTFFSKEQVLCSLIFPSHLVEQNFLFFPYFKSCSFLGFVLRLIVPMIIAFHKFSDLRIYTVERIFVSSHEAGVSLFNYYFKTLMFFLLRWINRWLRRNFDGKRIQLA